MQGVADTVPVTVSRAGELGMWWAGALPAGQQEHDADVEVDGTLAVRQRAPGLYRLDTQLESGSSLLPRPIGLADDGFQIVEVPSRAFAPVLQTGGWFGA